MTGFVEETTNLLSRTPALLRALLIGLPDAWTDTPDTAEGWRPRDVVGHLITGEQTDWMVRTRRILEEGTSVPASRFERFAMLERDAGVPLDQLVERFAQLRDANMTALRDLVTDADLDRRGRRPLEGVPRDPSATQRSLRGRRLGARCRDHRSTPKTDIAGQARREHGPEARPAEEGGPGRARQQEARPHRLGDLQPAAPSPARSRGHRHHRGDAGRRRRDGHSEAPERPAQIGRASCRERV